MAYTIPLLCLLLVFTVGPDLALADTERILKPVKRPMAADNFSLKTLKGKRFRLSAYKGKVVLLNFWATWCPPCIKEMPSMMGLYRSRKSRGFEVVAISVDKASSKVVTEMAGELGLDFTLLHDPDSITGVLYNISGVPYSYLIDSRGVKRYKAAGAVEWDSPGVVAIVDTLLNENQGEAQN